MWLVWTAARAVALVAAEEAARLTMDTMTYRADSLATPSRPRFSQAHRRLRIQLGTAPATKATHVEPIAPRWAQLKKA